MGVALEDLSITTKNPNAKVLADTLNRAVGRLLTNGKSPKRKVMELDNRGSHFYLALYWADELAKQEDSLEMKHRFISISNQLNVSESKILGELIMAEGKKNEL